MKIEFNAQSIDDLRARYLQAIKKNYNSKAVEMGLSKRPGEQPENIFDCEDGLRLIISRDDGQIHFSASVEPATRLYRDLQIGAYTKEGFLSVCVFRFKKISQLNDVRLHFWGFSEGKGVPHWFVEKQT